jgi:hypothetical protein
MEWVVNATPPPFYPREWDPVPVGWAPGPVWTGAEDLTPTGIRSPARPALSESLYRLSYPGPLYDATYQNILLCAVKSQQLAVWWVTQKTFLPACHNGPKQYEQCSAVPGGSVLSKVCLLKFDVLQWVRNLATSVSEEDLLPGKMEAARSTETSISFYRTRRRRIPEDTTSHVPVS